MGLQHGTTIRRVVTGHARDGAATIMIDDRRTPVGVARGDAEFALVWTTPTVPADNNDDTDGATREAGLTLHGGSVIRVVDIGPGEVSPMHRSNSIDYGILLSGELELELEGGAVTKLAPGDIVVQRGTNHLWRNPNPRDWCRIAFILTEAKAVRVNGQELPEIHP
jgi:quercetin dioxygenase-like cupin family protein